MQNRRCLRFERQRIILLIVHRELSFPRRGCEFKPSWVIFWHWYNLSKKERVLMPVPFSFAKIPIKKDMSEFWGLNVTSQTKAGTQTTRGLIHIQRDAWGSRRPFPSVQSNTMFSGNGTSRGSFLPSCGIKKIPHMWYISWYFKKYHISGIKCTFNGTKSSIVVSKDTTYVIHFADASKKGLFSDSPFLVFWVHQHEENKCRNSHLSDLLWQHCYSSEWQWMGFLGGTCSP